MLRSDPHFVFPSTSALGEDLFVTRSLDGLQEEMAALSARIERANVRKKQLDQEDAQRAERERMRATCIEVGDRLGLARKVVPVSAPAAPRPLTAAEKERLDRSDPHTKIGAHIAALQIDARDVNSRTREASERELRELGEWTAA